MYVRGQNVVLRWMRTRRSRCGRRIICLVQFGTICWRRLSMVIMIYHATIQCCAVWIWFHMLTLLRYNVLRIMRHRHVMLMVIQRVVIGATVNDFHRQSIAQFIQKVPVVAPYSTNSRCFQVRQKLDVVLGIGDNIRILNDYKLIGTATQRLMHGTSQVKASPLSL